MKVRVRVLSVAIAAMAMAAAWAASAIGAPGSSLDRPDEPIVIQYTQPVPFGDVNAGFATGTRNYDLPSKLHGIEPNDLVGFRWDPTTGWDQIPVQVDERQVMDINRIYGPGYPSCSDPCYTKPPNGAEHINYTDPNTYVGADTNAALDPDDEVALNASDAGAQTSSGEAPAGVDPASAVEVKITDPLDSSDEGYVYLFENNTDLDPAAGAPDIEYQFQLADGLPYKDPAGSYKPTGTAARSMARGPRPETSFVQTPNYRRGFTDRFKDDELRIFRGSATGADILDRHDAQFDTLDASCVRTQATYAQGEGAFVTNKTGPIRAIRDYIGANSGPHVQRQHLFYNSKETINTFLRVHPVPGVTDFFDYSAAATAPSMTYSNGAETLGTITAGVPIDGTQDPVPPAPGLSGLDGWEAVSGPQGGLVMPQAFVTNNPDPSYHLNYRDGSLLGPNPCNGDDFIYGASGPQGNSAFNNTDEAGAAMWGGGQFSNLYYKRSIFYEPPGPVDGNQRLDEELNPLALEFTEPSLTEPDVNQPPTARFTFSPPAPQTGDTVNFDGSSSTDDSSIAGYEWDLDGDSQFDDSTVSMPTFIYTSGGNYQVSLRVTDDEGATDVFTQTVVVAPNQEPIASFTFSPASPTPLQTVNLNALASSDPGGTIADPAGYQWDLDDDGQFDDATGSTTSTSFNSGSHEVSLRVTDNDGATDETSRTIVVNGTANQPPNASFTTSPLVALTGQPINLDGSASADTDGGTIADPAGYEWEFDGTNGFDDDTGPTSSTSYATPGTYTIKLRVTDDGGATDIATQQVVVQAPANSPPTSSFIFGPSDPEVGEVVDFDGTASSDPEDVTIADPAGYEWDFDGDGQYDDGTGSDPSHTYTAARSGLVGLKVTDSDGASDTSVQVLTVTDPNQPPAASFDYAPTTPQTGQTVSFASTSTDDDSIDTYEWDLDDDGQFDDSGAAAAAASFSTPGFHNVRLRVTDDDGASSVATENIEVTQSAASGSGGATQGGQPSGELCRGVPATLQARSNGATLTGSNGVDVIVGSPGDDTLIGLDGKDVICGRGGTDTIQAGPGFDAVIGNAGDDILTGGGGSDVLRGNKGNDEVRGGGSRDTLGGGAGDDLVDGGPGRDSCAGGPGSNSLRNCE